jgi:hypothetical protein
MRTTAQELAESYRLRYRNVDIDLDCKNRIKYRPSSEFSEQKQTHENLLTSDPYAKAWSLVREYHIYATLVDDLRQFGESSLLIVGSLHADPIIRLLPDWIVAKKVEFTAP